MRKIEASAINLLTKSITEGYDDEKTTVQTFYTCRNIGLLEGLDESTVRTIYKSRHKMTNTEVFERLLRELKD